MREPFSMGEMRRRAPLHFLAKADNARYSAYILSKIDDASSGMLAGELGYGGTTSIALGEGFRREMAIALELIIKAVIAQMRENDRLERKPHVTNVPMSHDVVQLWSEAQLPKLPDADMYRLVMIKSLLTWSSRYAAPRKDDVYDEEREQIRPFRDVVSRTGDFEIERPRPLKFEDLDRLYGMAAEAFWALRSKYN